MRANLPGAPTPQPQDHHRDQQHRPHPQQMRQPEQQQKMSDQPHPQSRRHRPPLQPAGGAGPQPAHRRPSEDPRGQPQPEEREKESQNQVGRFQAKPPKGRRPTSTARASRTADPWVASSGERGSLCAFNIAPREGGAQEPICTLYHKEGKNATSRGAALPHPIHLWSRSPSAKLAPVARMTPLR